MEASWPSLHEKEGKGVLPTFAGFPPLRKSKGENFCVIEE